MPRQNRMGGWQQGHTERAQGLWPRDAQRAATYQQWAIHHQLTIHALNRETNAPAPPPFPDSAFTILGKPESVDTGSQAFSQEMGHPKGTRVIVDHLNANDQSIARWIATQQITPHFERITGNTRISLAVAPRRRRSPRPPLSPPPLHLLNRTHRLRRKRSRKTHRRTTSIGTSRSRGMSGRLHKQANLTKNTTSFSWAWTPRIWMERRTRGVPAKSPAYSR